MKRFPPRMKGNDVANIILPLIPTSFCIALYMQASGIYIPVILLSVPRAILCHGSLLFTVLWVSSSSMKSICQKNRISTFAYYFFPITLCCCAFFAQFHFCLTLFLIAATIILTGFCGLHIYNVTGRINLCKKPAIRIGISTFVALFIIPSYIMYTHKFQGPTYKATQELWEELLSSSPSNRTNSQTDPFEANLELLKSFQPESWDQITSLEKRMDLCQRLVVFECQQRLGIEIVPVIAENLGNNAILGFYSPDANEIRINLTYLHTAKSTDLLETLLHEVNHAYTHSLVRLLTDLEADFETQTQMMYFDEIRSFRENMGDYHSASEDFDLYSNQPLEVEARNWSKEESARIRSYWE